ncbi:MAG: sugar transporter permease [Anaerocolumna sp.]|jgi:raffinose/stachyose/melibiose transport system permease protein|nr:sugar transporter permease [Anaerocolumna sp.]
MKRIGKLICESLIILICLAYLFPIYIVLVNSFKNRQELYENMIALPNSFSMEYFKKAMGKMDFFHAFGNSLLVTVISLVIIVILSSMTAWMFVRTNNKLSRFLFMTFVATMIIPFQTIMMPLMQVMGWVRDTLHIPMLNTLGGLIYMNIGFGTSMAVFLYHGFVKSIPISLEEAATIDGCNKFGVFYKIVFPMLKPTTATVMILDVIWIWNDYLLPSLVLSSKNLRTIPLSTASFFGQFTIEWNLAMAGLMLTITPVIIFYLTAQKYIVKGVAAGAVKL